MPKRVVDVTPSAARLTTSLRDIGYDFTTAVADLIDNSLSAGGREISVDFEFLGNRSYILITDNGSGMGPSELDEAMRFGSRRQYSGEDLGRYGLGLKTASLSQCRRVTVITRRAPARAVIHERTLDLDHVISKDRWQVFRPSGGLVVREGHSRLSDGPGTVVALQKLDRVFDGVDADSGWGRRRLEKLASETSDYLAMVFHRFLEGTDMREPVTMMVNGEKLRPWNPFAPNEEHTRELQSQRLAVPAGNGKMQTVTLKPYILPPRSHFSTSAEFERLSGPRKWNRQQGLYIYRANRLVQSGGWSGLRAADEHTKLARASLDFPTALDEEFKVDVAKMKVVLPASIREMLARPVNEVCVLADATYRSAQRRTDEADEATLAQPETIRGSQDLRTIGLALRVAASLAGEVEALDKIAERLRVNEADIAESLGL